MRIIICALVSLVALSYVEGTTTGRVVCYFNNGAVNRPGLGRYGVEDIPFDKCTHVAFSFIGLTNTSEIALLNDPKDFTNFVSMKKSYPQVKFMVVIGGWDEGGAKYSHMVSTNATRATFVNSVVDFLNMYNFDGLDLDWEYPGAVERDGVPEDKENFLILVQSLRKAFDNQGKGWELTCAVPLTQQKLAGGYDVPGLCKALNAVNVMTYDLHGNWDGVALPHSALFKAPRDKGANEHINVHDGLQLWVNMGCPANKLVVGVPFYGRSYILMDAANHDIGAPINTTTGGAPPQPYTESTGLWSYYEICSLLKQSGWTRKWDKYGKVPYAFNGLQWVGYDDPQSVKRKMDFIKEKGYLGAMTWSIDMDDFRGSCGTKNPLISIMHSQMKSYTVPDSTENDIGYKD